MARTIQEVLDLIIEGVPGAPQAGSVDVLKSGDPNWEVTGIVTTFTASMDALRRTVELGANLVITHEPTYYDHYDRDWLPGDPVVQAKRAFIEEHKLAIFRFHDYWHMHKPDGIMTGMLRVLEWETYKQDKEWMLLVIPGMTVGKLAASLKEKLALPIARVVGDPEQPCERIGLIVGAIGGEFQVKAFERWQLDAIICGETVEWQTCEYVRDANALGFNKALLIAGHARSEEEGMRYLVEWLQPKVPELSITYLAVGDPVSIL